MNRTRVCLQRLALWPVLLVVASCNSGSTDEESIESARHAVYDRGLFELDGNVTDAPEPGDDWGAVALGVSAASMGTTGVLADQGTASVFLGGGSKDTNDLDKWKWKDGSTPDKDNITNSYAAAYNANGELIIYFGADRFAQDGDAQLGFWFFQNDVSPNPDGSFSGTHAIGDILVLSNFTQGGSVGEVQVYKWVGSGGSDGALDLVEGGAVVNAGTNIYCLGDEHVCASVNTADEPAQWAYQPKSGTPNVIPPGGFFEGGINISQTVPGTACVASFLAETRSSTSPSATLKDFSVGSLPTCSLAVERTCAVVGLNPDSTTLFVATYTISVTNTGATTLPAGTTVTVTDAGGDVQTLTLAAPLAAGQSVSFPSYQVPTDDNPPQNDFTATASTGTTTIAATPSSPACQPFAVIPALSLTMTCTTALQQEACGVVVQVNYSGEVCNTGNIPLTVTDDRGGAVINGLVLDAGACAPYSGSYVPTQATDAAQGLFGGTMTVTGTHPAASTAATASATATCGLCAQP